MKKVLLATNNKAKIERYENLVKIAGLSVLLETPKSVGIEIIDVVEDEKTLEGNALKKARAYFGKVEIPILSNDTGFWVDGEGLIDAPKRVALQGEDENALSIEEKGKLMAQFWKNIATKYGGKVDAAWIEAFVLIDTKGIVSTVHTKREVVLTNQEHGKTHPQFPIRALYYSKATGKPSLQQTKEEEMLEMKPIVDALKELLG